MYTGVVSIIFPMMSFSLLTKSSNPWVCFISSVALSNMDRKSFSKASTTHSTPFVQRIAMNINMKHEMQVSSRSSWFDVVSTRIPKIPSRRATTVATTFLDRKNRIVSSLVSKSSPAMLIVVLIGSNWSSVASKPSSCRRTAFGRRLVRELT